MNKVNNFDPQFPTCPTCNEITSNMSADRHYLGPRFDGDKAERYRYTKSVSFRCGAQAFSDSEEGAVWKWSQGCPKAMEMAVTLWPAESLGNSS